MECMLTFALMGSVLMYFLIGEYWLCFFHFLLTASPYSDSDIASPYSDSNIDVTTHSYNIECSLNHAGNLWSYNLTFLNFQITLGLWKLWGSWLFSRKRC